MIENKNIDKQNDIVTSALQNLINNLASIKNIIDAADHNSTFASNIDLIIKRLLPIVKKELKEKPGQINIDVMVASIKHLNQLVIRQKSMNPLISDELVTLSMQTERMVIQLQALLDKDTSR